MNADWKQRNDRWVPGRAGSHITVALILCGICFVVWLVHLASQDNRPIWDTPLGRYMVLKSNQFDPRTILTHNFLHESFLHLIANMACIWLVARALEPRWGSLRFAGFILLAALACGLSAYPMDILFRALVDTSGESVTFGASGVALACLTAYVLSFEDRPLMGFLTERYLIWSGILAGATLLVYYQNSLPARLIDPNVRLTPHLSGIAIGIVLGLGFLRWERASRHFLRGGPGRRTRARPGEELDLQARVDQLLEKISREGMESLSAEEKTFLLRASKHFRNPNS